MPEAVCSRNGDFQAILVVMSPDEPGVPFSGGPGWNIGADRHPEVNSGLRCEDDGMWRKNGAGDGIRTHDNHVGNVMLYP